MNRFDRSTRPGAWISNDAMEGWTYIAAMDDFTACDPGEYIRVFPRLLPRNGLVPTVLRGHLGGCLAALAWQCRADGHEGPMAILSAALGFTAAEASDLGEREHERWFPGFAASPPASFADPGSPVNGLEAFALVDALHREIDVGGLRAFEQGVAAMFSHTTGIHAAYLWPEALLSHEFYAAVGWLGHLWRGRRAHMPGDLAEYFVDVIDLAPDGTPTVRDPYLARFLPEIEVVSEVRRAILARRSGASAVAAWPGIASRTAAGSALARSARHHDGRPS